MSDAAPPPSPQPPPISGAALWQWRQRALATAQAQNIDPLEVDWLLQQLYGVDRLALRLGTLAQVESLAAPLSLEELEQRWQHRWQQRVPIQYLAQQTPWGRFMLGVGPGVLIPRPETELLVELMVAAVAQSPQAAVLEQGIWVDLGTGSGAIALGLAAALPQAQILAVDISPVALQIAQQNALATGLADRITFLQGSWFDPLASRSLAHALAGIVANPPYIPTDLIPTLQPEVARHEPTLALDGGADGLDAVRQLVHQAPQFLQPGGLWGVELMADQGPTVANWLAATGRYSAIRQESDLGGIGRFVLAHRA